MKLADHEIELYLNIYTSAKSLIPAKDRPDWAFRFLDIMNDNGIEIKVHTEEIIEACPYLDQAMDIVSEDEEPEDWEIDQDDEWE